MAETVGDPKDVALAALTNLVRLMGAELVAGRHRDDLGQFERAVRAKIDAVTVVGCPTAVAEAGLTLARSHAEQALAQIRAQADAAQIRDAAQAVTQQAPAVASASPVLH